MIKWFIELFTESKIEESKLNKELDFNCVNRMNKDEFESIGYSMESKVEATKPPYDWKHMEEYYWKCTIEIENKKELKILHVEDSTHHRRYSSFEVYANNELVYSYGWNKNIPDELKLYIISEEEKVNNKRKQTLEEDRKITNEYKAKIEKERQDKMMKVLR